jgi:ABC-type phosphate/phosphonate transport system ATPase subunit
MITFEDVSKVYPGGTVAVDNLTITAPNGKITTLVGPSGCGKTTSMRMINRLIEPTSGSINFKDFVSLDAGGTLTMTALTNGQIQTGDLFSTDPGLVTNNLVALDDDKSLFAAENVVPLIKSAKQNDTITKTLDAVSAKLTTDDLISMNAEAAKGTNLSDIAKKWLANAGISKS